MTLFIDVDGTICNFLSQYAKFYMRDFGIHVNWNEISDYNLEKNFLKLNKIDKYKYLRNSEFYKDIEFMPKAIDYINLLHKEGHKIYFSTSCVTYESMLAKFDLLQRNFKFFEIEKFLVLNRKNYLYVKDGILIDDSPYVFENSKMPIKICLDWKYNRNVQNVNFRNSDWLEIYTYIQSITY